jgi:hypothetical protein
MLHPHRTSDSENDDLWTPEADWEARSEARTRRAEMAHLIADGMPMGAHPDYLAILDADDPRILQADFPPLLPALLRGFRSIAKRVLTAFVRKLPMMHPKVAAMSDARHAGRDGSDPFCRTDA